MQTKTVILYISVRVPHLRQGPTHSIPSQIKAQSKYDNVLWLNLVNSDNSAVKDLFAQVSWKSLSYYMDLSNNSQISLRNLPAPFNKPDLIIFEQFYPFGKHIPFVYKLIRSKIPYIIIPRGELTYGAQQQKKWKKKVANFLFFSYFARKAIAIEYLTQQEKQTAGNCWNNNGIVIPNGTTLPQKTSKIYQEKNIRMVYIGRLDIFHKGLDLMLQACALLKTNADNINLRLDMYGPDLKNYRAQLQHSIDKLALQNFVRLHGPLYKEDKSKVLEQADAFIMTSRFEGHPMGLIEALAYGLPCVVTTGTNMREEIEKYNAGWTADNTITSVAGALKQMLAQRNQLTQKSVNARTLATQYDWDKLAQRSHEIYEKIIRGNK